MHPLLQICPYVQADSYLAAADAHVDQLDGAVVGVRAQLDVARLFFSELHEVRHDLRTDIEHSRDLNLAVFNSGLGGLLRYSQSQITEVSPPTETL